MKRTDIINHLIDKYNYSTYLEIGVQKSQNNFKAVKAPIKEGVDPNVECTYKMTSDQFFRSIPEDKMYDLIFIDGLHLEDQALRDIENSLKHLNPSGIIVVHDCNPPARKYQRKRPPLKGIWPGTVWRAIAKLRMMRKDIFICVVDTDWGCGIIKRGSQKPFTPHVKNPVINYCFLKKYRKKLLNLVSIEEFYQIG